MATGVLPLEVTLSPAPSTLILVRRSDMISAVSSGVSPGTMKVVSPSGTTAQNRVAGASFMENWTLAKSAP